MVLHLSLLHGICSQINVFQYGLNLFLFMKNRLGQRTAHNFLLVPIIHFINLGFCLNSGIGFNIGSFECSLPRGLFLESIDGLLHELDVGMVFEVLGIPSSKDKLHGGRICVLECLKRPFALVLDDTQSGINYMVFLCIITVTMYRFI